MGPHGRAVLRGLLLVSILAAPACGDVNAGDDPFAGMVLYEDPAGAFSLRLLEPPWLPPLSLDGETAFVVPPSDIAITTDPSVILSEALYSLQVQTEPGASAALAAAFATALPPASMMQQQSAQTASGLASFEVAWQESPTQFRRDVFLAASPTQAFHLLFTAGRPIGDDPMITQMIASFRVGT